MSKVRYLRSLNNGRVLPWTAALHGRSDMVPATVEDVEAANKRQVDDAARRAIEAAKQYGLSLPDEKDAVPADPYIPEPPAQTESGDKPLPTLDDVMAIDNKEQLIALGVAYGMELSARKAVKTLQSDLIIGLGLE